MSTDLVALQNQLPASMRDLLAKQVAEDISRLGSTGGKTIRVTQDKKFQLPDGTASDELHVAIVDFVYRNEYYPGVYNRKEITPPACFAISPTAADLAPSPNSPSAQSTNCRTCQQNQFGSSPTGDGKACKNTVYMAVLPPDATSDSQLMVIKTSPTAIKHFNAYVGKVARQLNAPVTAVQTRLFFDPESTYASLRFEAVGVNPAFEETLSRKDEARHRLLEEPEVAAEAK